jgi:hypothetical protein
MSLTAAEARQLRYLLKKAGLEVPPDLSPRKRGKRELADDPMLAGLELFLRIAKRDLGMSRKAALHRFFDGIYKRGKFGASANAVVARIDRKLREHGFNKRDIKTLVVPPGVDPTMIRIGFETTKFIDDKADD